MKCMRLWASGSVHQRVLKNSYLADRRPHTGPMCQFGPLLGIQSFSAIYSFVSVAATIRNDDDDATNDGDA